MAAVQVFFEGNVQGVGFRYSIKQIAKGFEVTGFARNLRDGRVELQSTGDEAEVNAFLEAVSASEMQAHIKKRTQFPLADGSVFRGFEIRHE